MCMMSACLCIFMRACICVGGQEEGAQNVLSFPACKHIEHLTPLNLSNIEQYSGPSGDHSFQVRTSNTRVWIGIEAVSCFMVDVQRICDAPIELEGLVFSSGDLGGNSKRFNLDDKVWRHLAVQLEEHSHQLKFFLDGSLANGNPLPVHVDSRGVTYDWFPVGEEMWRMAFAGGNGQSLHDVRAYVHEAGRDSPKILSLAETPTPLLDSLFKCLPPSSPDLVDTAWTDGRGRDCQWYFNAKQVDPRVCDLMEAAKHCPNSCASRTECFTDIQAAAPPVYFAFDRTRLMVPKHANGSLCLGSTFKRQKIVQQCKDWLASGELGSLGGRGGRDDPVAEDTRKWMREHDRAISQWLDTVWVWSKELAVVEGKHLNITDCEQLEAAIDEDCNFDMQPVADFTRDAKDSDGYSLGFWVKPVGSSSLSDSGPRARHQAHRKTHTHHADRHTYRRARSNTHIHTQT